jgi:NAD(P)-dependent dehydrogenase (short-subunit alcohol dehydrogenase family)
MKTTVIFGATSGLGWAIAQTFHEKRWNTFCFGRRKSRLLGFKAGFCQHLYLNNQFYCGDIRNKQDIFNAFKLCLDNYGRIDRIFVTAAIYRDDSCSNINDNIRNVFEVNFWGYVNVVTELQKFHKLIKIPIPVIAISSTLAERGIPGSLPYSLSKAALENFVKLIKCDIPEETINCLSYVAPPFNSEMNPNSSESALRIANDLYERFKVNS